MIALTESSQSSPDIPLFDLAVALIFQQPKLELLLDDDSKLHESFLSFRMIFGMEAHPMMVDQDLLEEAAVDATGPMKRFAVMSLRKSYDKRPELESLLEEFRDSAALRAEFVKIWNFEAANVLKRLDEWIRLEPENGYPRFLRLLYRIGPLANSDYIPIESKIPLGSLAAAEVKQIAQLKERKDYRIERLEAICQLREELGLAFHRTNLVGSHIGQVKIVNRSVRFRIENNLEPERLDEAAAFYAGWSSLIHRLCADGSFISESLRIAWFTICEKAWSNQNLALPVGVAIGERRAKAKQSSKYSVANLKTIPVPALFNATCKFLSEDEVAKTEALMEKYGVELE
ncbi:MAG: hypothetical protein AAF585_10025 [Verrucomicrobiota bacterium]